MKTLSIESSGPLRLTIVLRELAETLIKDDWARWSTGDDTSFYYIVGMKAHQRDQDGDHHLSLSIGNGRPVSVVGEHQVHAQVASLKGGEHYVRQARARLEAAGIEPVLIDRFLERFEAGDVETAFEGWHVNVPGTDRLDALINFMQALAIRRGAAIETFGTDAERKRELDLALEKVYLEQLARLFEGVVRRAGGLDTLAVSDAQLNEASRCYLYGFFRATVLLSAGAVEKCLKEALCLGERDHVEYKPLVADAVSMGKLGTPTRIGVEPVLADYARDIFAQRNLVAHRGQEPPSHAAAELLVKAREVVEFVRRHSR